MPTASLTVRSIPPRSWGRRTFLSMMATGLLLFAAGCTQEQKTGSQGGPADVRGGTPSREVTIAAASDLKFALDSVIFSFQEKHPSIAVKASYGSSGNFYSQLSNRAPFDLFFSADIDYPKKLAEQGLALRESLFEYAVGQIVVWVPNDSPLDVEKLGIEALTRPEATKVAIANPDHAPYGKAAVAAMTKLGVYDRVKDRLVLGENISQTAQFVESGAADAGVIALSLAMAPKMRAKGRYWSVPLESYPRLLQGGVVMEWAKEKDATNEFVTFVRGADGRAILRSYGFLLPGE